MPLVDLTNTVGVTPEELRERRAPRSRLLQEITYLLVLIGSDSQGNQNVAERSDEVDYITATTQPDNQVNRVNNMRV
jgi:hypothetical protein